jgi:hypothetical protein
MWKPEGDDMRKTLRMVVWGSVFLWGMLLFFSIGIQILYLSVKTDPGLETIDAMGSWFNQYAGSDAYTGVQDARTAFDALEPFLLPLAQKIGTDVLPFTGILLFVFVMYRLVAGAPHGQIHTVHMGTDGMPGALPITEEVASLHQQNIAVLRKSAAEIQKKQDRIREVGREVVRLERDLTPVRKRYQRRFDAFVERRRKRDGMFLPNEADLKRYFAREEPALSKRFNDIFEDIERLKVEYGELTGKPYESKAPTNVIEMRSFRRVEDPSRI